MKKTLFPLLIWWCLFFGVLGWKPDFAYNAQRYFEWLLLGSMVIWGAIQPVRFEPSRSAKMLGFALLVMAVGVVVAAPEKWLAVRDLLAWVAPVLAALAIAKTRLIAVPDAFDRAALLGVTCLCFGASLIALEGLFVSLSIHEISHLVIFSAFVNVRIMADIQFATLMLLPAAWLLAKSRTMRIWVSVTAALWWGWLFFSGTRAALVVVPWALVVVWMCAGWGSLAWTKRLLVQMLSGGALFGVTRWLLQTEGMAPDYAMKLVRPGAGSSGRFEHWQEAWQHFLLHPWLGNGPGAYACFTTKLEAGPHNIVFSLLSGWGWPITVLVSVLALLAFITMVLCVRGEAKRNPVALSLFASVVAIVTAAQFQGILGEPLGQMTVVLVFGWAWHVFAVARFTLVASNEKERVHWQGALRWSLVWVVLFVWLIMAKMDIALQKTLLVLPDGTINITYGPGYWADGHDHCPAWHARYRQETGLAP